MSDIQKKVLVDFQLANDDAQSQMSGLATAVNQVATSVKDLQNITKTSQTALTEYAEKLAQSKLSAQQNREEITKLNLAKRQEKDAIDKAKGSLVAAKGSYDEAQKSLTALGRAIKSAEGGFKSTDPAIQKQIADYKKLNTELGAFDKKLGNHQRNVGNYEGALDKVSSQLGRLIPGFDQLQGILKDAAQGFNAMGNGAKSAGEAGVGAEEAISAGAVAAGVAIAAVTAAIIAEGAYLLQFQTYADALSKSWEGIKAGARAAMGAINGVGNETKSTGNIVTDMSISFTEAFTEAYVAQGRFIDANRQIKIDAVEAKEENAQIRKDMLVIMNLKSDEVTFQRAYNEAHALTVKQYNTETASQEKLHKAIVDRALAGNAIDKKTAESLKDIKGGYMAILNVTKQLTAHDKVQAAFLDEMVQSAEKGIEIQGHYDVIEQLEKNKADRKQARLDKESSKAERDREKAENDLLEAKRAGDELIAERGAALTKIVQDQQEAFAKELSTTDEHYRQLIFKQREFILKQEQLRNKTKSSKAKAQFTKNIAGANDLIGTYKEGNAADIDKQVTDYYKKQAEAIQKGQEELANMRIGNIQDVNRRELALLDQRQENEQLAYKKEQDLLVENVGRLQNEIKIAKGAEKQALKANLDQQLQLQSTNQDKSLASLTHYLQERKNAIKRASDEELELQDQTAVLKAKYNNTSGTNDSGELAAQQKQLLDQYNIEVSQKGLTDAKKLELEQKYLLDKQMLNQQYDKKQQAYDIEVAQTVANGAFQILEQSLARSAQANEVYLNRQKEHDMQNRSLTETQKYEVSEKYRILAGKQKVKEFKQEQAIALAKGAIDTAAAILKASPNVPLMVLAGITGAIQEGIIAAQRAPAYAKGGIHYSSDGKGGVLPGYSKTDNTNAYLRSGEAVVVSEAMRDPWAKSVVSAINQAYGGRPFDGSVSTSWVKPGFAAGGVFNNYLPTGDNGVRPQMQLNSRMHPDDINGIAGAVANIKFPELAVDVKDMNYQQGRLAGVYDRLSY